jgi:hypothetical protein
MDKKPIAICIAEAGYGTGWYDRETDECFYEKYASVEEVILNEEYWNQYEYLSSSLSYDFDLGFCFDMYKLIVYDNGDKEAIKIKKIWNGK